MDPSEWRCTCVDDKEGYNGLCAVICLMRCTEIAQWKVEPQNMRRVTHERYISQSQWVNCDLGRRYVGLNLSQQRTTLESLNNTWTTVGSGNNSRERGGGVIEKNAKKFPNLSAVMARQYLGCPATSATVERLFSQVGISFSPKRQSAQAATVADIIFTKINVAWLYETWDEITSAVVALCFYAL